MRRRAGSKLDAIINMHIQLRSGKSFLKVSNLGAQDGFHERNRMKTTSEDAVDRSRRHGTNGPYLYNPWGKVLLQSSGTEPERISFDYELVDQNVGVDAIEKNLSKSNKFAPTSYPLSTLTFA